MSSSEQFSTIDRVFMARALEVALNSQFTASPNPGVGCVLVRNDKIIAEGWTQKPGQAHAEIDALNKCASGRVTSDQSTLAQGTLAKGATAYVTLEPCAHTGRTGPCCDALIEAGVAKVIAAIEDPHEQVSGRGFARLTAAGVEVQTGLMEDEARELHGGFIHRLTTGRPFVRLKIAASLDGATALGNGQSKWITDDAARADVHYLRAQSDAVVTGAGTVVADNPSLTARLDHAIEVTQPRAVILDSTLRSPLSSHVFARNSLVYTRDNIPRADAVAFEQASLPATVDGSGLDLLAMLDDLGRRKINTVLVEAGADLSGAFVRQGLVNELVVYQAPRLMGSAARGMLNLGELTSMNQLIDLHLVERIQVGVCLKQRFRFL